MGKKVLAVALIIIGIVALILGGTCAKASKEILDMDNGTYMKYYEYGGDAYTGIQNAAARTANNLQYEMDILEKGFSSVVKALGSVLTVAGLTLLAIGLYSTYDEFVAPTLAGKAAAAPSDPGVVPEAPTVQAEAPETAAAPETATEPAAANAEVPNDISAE